MTFVVRSCLVFWLLLGLALTSAAHADDPLAKPNDPIAKEHLQQGNKLYRIHEFEKAIAEYKAGALKEDAPVFLYNLGQCYRQLGKYQEAIWQYERFLSRAQPVGDLRASVEDFIRQMKAELDKKAMTQPPTEPAPDGPKPQPSAPTQAVTDRSEPEPWYVDTLGWSLAGVGALGLGVGGYFLIDAASIDEQANTEPSQEVRQQLRDKAGTRRVIGAFVGIAGLGLLAGGVIKLYVHTPSDEQAVSWGIGVNGSGIQVFGRF